MAAGKRVSIKAIAYALNMENIRLPGNHPIAATCDQFKIGHFGDHRHFAIGDLHRLQERCNRRRLAAVIALDHHGPSPRRSQPEPQKTCGSIMGHEHAAGNTQPDRGCVRVGPVHAHGTADKQQRCAVAGDQNGIAECDLHLHGGFLV
jgi:hypothetical protein